MKKLYDLLFPICRVYKYNYGCGYKKGKLKRVFILKYLLNNNLLGLSEDGIHRKHSIYQMPKE